MDNHFLKIWKDPPPTKLDPMVEYMCLSTQAIAAHLKQVKRFAFTLSRKIPNQPIIFNGDGVKRSEDAMIGEICVLALIVQLILGHIF